MYLSSRGYTIEKASLSDEELQNIKKELTVCPNIIDGYGPQGAAEQLTFKNYLESKSKLYLPKAYGLKQFGVPTLSKISEGDDINVEFKGNLRPQQQEPVNMVLDACRDPARMGGLLCLKCGEGKCLGKDTPVLMYDSTIKMVQDVKVGDILMGDDSQPRHVKSVCTGLEMMYKVHQCNGEPYVVNKSHILTLQNTKGEVVDMPLTEVLKDPLYMKKYKGLRTCLNFSEKPIDFDPYIVGYWLGDLESYALTVTIKHKNIAKYMECTLPFYNCYLEYSGSTNIHLYSIIGHPRRDNKFLHFLFKSGLLNTRKHIPLMFKHNSVENRCQLLAGIVDANLKYKDGIGYYMTFYNETLKNDVMFLARSLGFKCTELKPSQLSFWKKLFKHRDVMEPTATHYVSISFERACHCIPVKGPLQILYTTHNYVLSRESLLSEIRIEKLGVDTYYGFEIDGNRRFLLGDTTVTHNTICAINMICTLAKKTLIIVHKEFLLQQWRERIQEFAPSARLGLIKGKVIDVDDKDIVIASLQSLAMKDYEDATLNTFGTLVIDEAHHMGAQVFSQALKKTNFKYSIGLTATPKRKDGLSKVFLWYLGDIVYNSKQRKDTLQVVFKEYYDSDPRYSKEHLLYNNKPNMARMINNICEFAPRTMMICEEIRGIFAKECARKILILSDRRQHLNDIHKTLEGETFQIPSGFYYGGLSPADLKESEEKPVILATFQYASEGFDLKGLDTLILASPKSDVIQVVGRILRDKPEDRKHIPLVVDIVDAFSMFEGQAKKRYKYYKSCKYHIEDKDNIFKSSVTSGKEVHNKDIGSLLSSGPCFID